MSEQIKTALTAPNAPFEYAQVTIGDHSHKVFKQALPCLSHVYQHLDAFSERDLVVYGERRLSYQHAMQKAAGLAQLLRQQYHVQAGQHIALAMRNSPEWVVSFIAITALGAVPALVNSRGAADELSHAIHSVDCTLIISDHKTRQQLNTALPLLVFDIDQDCQLHDHTGAILSLDTTTSLPITNVDTDDVALILFTSGTTGRPKGAMLTHRGVMNALKANEYSSAIIGATIAARMGIDLATLAAHAPQSSTLLMFPLFHVSGCHSVLLAGLLRGGKLVMLARWQAPTALRIMQDEAVTNFYGVPTMYWDLINNADCSAYDLSALQSLSVAGQATSPALLEKITATFPHAMMGTGYGMTETNGVIALSIGADFIAAPNSVGYPLSIAEVKIVTPQGTTAQALEHGEIHVRGVTVMRGYYPLDHTSDGWLATGDVGYQDHTGRLYIVDRLTDMVIVGGENVYCAEIERVLEQMPDVVEVVSFGVPDPRLGERVVALLRFQTGTTHSVQYVKEFAATLLASYKVPSELHIIEQPLERNAAGKILKHKAREWLDNKIWRLQK